MNHPEAPVYISEEDFDQVAAALWIVQQSGLYNMFMQASDAYTSAMCVLAAIGNGRVVRVLNTIGTGTGVGYIMNRWMRTYETNVARWKTIAENSPVGGEFIKAAERNMGNFGPSTVGTSETRRLQDFAKQHGLPWYKALVVAIEEECLRVGTEERSAGNPNLRGVYEPYLLKAAGAQVLFSPRRNPPRKARGPIFV